MTHVRFLALCFVLLATGCATQRPASTTLLPGITYYQGPERLLGKLVFLKTHDTSNLENSESAASIFEFDFLENTLKSSIAAPVGNLFTSGDGDIAGVIYWNGAWRKGNATNAFVYSYARKERRIINLEIVPQEIAAVGGHVFFRLYKSRGNGASFDRLLDYDTVSDERQWVEFPGASKWEVNGYWMLSVPAGSTNKLQFYYSHGGKRLVAGRDYRVGDYRLDVRTRQIEAVPEVEDSVGDAGSVAFDGRRVFFLGPNSPAVGFVLVSSPWDSSSSKQRDPKGEHLKVLHRFPKAAVLGGGSFVLSRISPCRRFALVRLQMPATSRSGMPGWVSTYYVVNVSNGDTRILLKEEVERVTTGSVSTMHWVGATR